MATITYIAKRSLMAGHVEGEEYTFEVPISDWTPRPRRQVASSTSLSGRRFERLTRIDREWRTSTVAEDDETIAWAVADEIHFLSSEAWREAGTVEPGRKTKHRRAFGGAGGGAC